MINDFFVRQIESNLPYTPNEEQKELLLRLGDFMFRPESD